MAIEPLTNGIPPISTHERATDQESMQTGRSGESSPCVCSGRSAKPGILVRV